MLDQYSPSQMAELFTDRARMARWLEIELAVMRAQESVGHAPAGTALRAEAKFPAADDQLVAAVKEQFTVTGHELAAFVDVVGPMLGDDETWFHAGLTSGDVLDTGTSLLLTRACDVLNDELELLDGVVRALAHEHATTPIMGRTHGMYAEPTTFGAKVTTWALRLDRDRERLHAARAAAAVGEMSGPVGTYMNIDPRVEQVVCAALGLGRSVGGQSISRDRYAQYVWACANVATTLESIATQVRLLHTSEIGELHESFGDGRKGSSSMPHKKNPVMSMELCGLARVVRGYLATAMESTVIWQEGDTTSLAVERIVMPDVSNVTCYAIGRARSLIASLGVDQRAMLAKFEDSRGLPFSSSLLQVLIDSGLGRDEAYRAVQRAATLARDEDLDLRDAFTRSADGLAYDAEQAQQAFSIDRALRNVPVIMAALDERNVDGAPAGAPKDTAGGEA